jgi:hypothetical protein
MDKLVCKHCQAELTKVLMPPDTDWGVEYLMVCMNDDCGYFIRGWKHMKEKYNKKASYRHQLNTFTGYEGPLPCTSKEDYTGWVVKKVRV